MAPTDGHRHILPFDRLKTGIGAHFEIKNGSEITKYYTSTVLSAGMACTTRIATLAPALAPGASAGARKYTIPQPMKVEYMLSDHLGSTSLTADADGNKVLEIRYKAWGEIRATWTNVPVDIDPAYKMPLYQYTGQASYMDDPTTSGVTEGFGLMFYNARWYDLYLNHFVQADTIVPGGVQGLDRYAAMNNNPVKYSDPSGHTAWQGDEGGCTTEIDCSSTSTEEKIEAYLAIGELDKAVHLAVTRWHIELRGASVSYNPYLEGDGRAPDRWHIEIGTSVTSAGQLAATLYHESVHIEQFRSGTNYAGTYLSSEGANMNELEAYTKEAAWVDENKIPLTPEERDAITDAIEQTRGILNKDNLALADQGLFVIMPSTINYPAYPFYYH